MQILPPGKRRFLPVVLIAMLAVPVSFGVGMRLSGDVQTVHPTSASEVLAGDMDGSGTVDMLDVTILLQIAQGNREATPAQLRADPNHDGRLTVEDAQRILRELPTP